MRHKLRKLLRALEKKSGFVNKYSDYNQAHQCTYVVEEYMDFPDFRFLIKQFNDDNVVQRNGIVIPFSRNNITGELKRMEADGLVMIGTQEGVRYASVTEGSGPETEDAEFTTESIVLTTQGRSQWAYYRQQLNTNPVPTILSISALVVSVLSLLVAWFKG